MSEVSQGEPQTSREKSPISSEERKQFTEDAKSIALSQKEKPQGSIANSLDVERQTQVALAEIHRLQQASPESTTAPLVQDTLETQDETPQQKQSLKEQAVNLFFRTLSAVDKMFQHKTIAPPIASLSPERMKHPEKKEVDELLDMEELRTSRYPNSQKFPGDKVETEIEMRKTPEMEQEYNECLQVLRSGIETADVIYIKRRGKIGDMIFGLGYQRAVEAAFDRYGIDTPIKVLIDPEQDFYDGYPREKTEFIPQASLGKNEETDYFNQDMKQHKFKNALVINLDTKDSGKFETSGSVRREKVSRQRTITSVDLFSDQLAIDWNNYSVGRTERFAAPIEAIFSLPSDDIPAEETQPRIPPSSDDEQRYQTLANDFGIKADKMHIVFNIEASKPGKRWSLENSVKLAELLKRKYPNSQILFLQDENSRTIGYMEDDIHTASQKHGLSKEQGDYTIIHSSLKNLCALFEKGEIALAVSNDSGVGHIAAAKGVDVLMPFRSTKAITPDTFTFGEHEFVCTPDKESENHDDITNSDEEHREEHKLINTITPEAMFTSAIALLEKSGNNKPLAPIQAKA